MPMGLIWDMPVPVACSLAVREGDFLVTCGQCPLDRAGVVIAPGDAAAQVAAVIASLRGIGGHHPDLMPLMLVVYHLCPDEGLVTDPLSTAFPKALIAPVRLPHFYLPGMMIEVDAYFGAGSSAEGPFRQAGDLRLSCLVAPDMATARAMLAGRDPARLLAADWFAADPPPAAWDPAPAVRVIPGPGAGVTAVLIEGPEGVQTSLSPGGAVLRRSGRHVWLSAVGTGGDLAAAAHQAMDGLALGDQPGLTVLKATTHYVGGPAPEDLYGNLRVRHARFPRPGPASTGVPVAGLAGGSLAIGMLGLAPAG